MFALKYSSYPASLFITTHHSDPTTCEYLPCLEISFPDSTSSLHHRTTAVRATNEVPTCVLLAFRFGTPNLPCLHPRVFLRAARITLVPVCPTQYLPHQKILCCLSLCPAAQRPTHQVCIFASAASPLETRVKFVVLPPLRLPSRYPSHSRVKLVVVLCDSTCSPAQHQSRRCLRIQLHNPHTAEHNRDFDTNRARRII